MRFERIELPAFGPFTDFALDFAERPRALQMVYGANEAGKSTLLRAIVALLYGVPARSTDAHTHEFSRLRIAATLRSAEGELLEVVRRKGLKHTLLDREEKPLAEGVLAPLLGGLDEALFRQMFGLDHERLREGAEALLRGGGHLGEGLFDAGSGARSIRRALEALRAEAESIYKPRGRTPKLNLQIDALREQRRKLRDATLSPQAYADQQRALREAARDREQLGERRRSLAAEHARLTRSLSLWPLLARKRTLERERARLAEECRRGAALAPGSVLSEQLDRLRERLANVHAFRLEQPERASDLKVLARDCELLEQRLGGLAPLALALDAPTRARLRRFADEERALAATRDELERALREGSERLARSEARIAELAPRASGSGELALLLGAIERDGGLAEGVHLDGELAREESQFARLVAQAAIAASARELAWLELPSDGELAELERAEVELDHALQRNLTSVRELERARLDGVRRRSELFAFGELATESDLARALGERDAAFSRIAAAYEAGERYDEELVRAYRQAAQVADELARRMRAEAQRYAELVRVDAELARVAAEAALLEKTRGELEARSLQLSARRLSFASKLQMQEVRSSRELRARLAKLTGLVERAGRIAELEQRRSERAARGREQQAALAWALREPPGAMGGDLASLLARAKAQLSERRERESELRHLEGRRAELLAEHEVRRTRLAELDAAAAALRARFERELSDHAIPSGLTATDLLACLADLEELARKRRALGEGEQRLREMAEREQELGRELLAIARECGLDAADGSASATLDVLTRAARAAAEAAQALAHCGSELEKLEPELERVAEGTSEAFSESGDFDPDLARARKAELEPELEQLTEALRDVDQRLGALRAGLARLEEPSSAVELAEQSETELASARTLARRYLEVRLATTLLTREIERYRSEHQGPVLARAAELFPRLTLGRYRGLEVDYDERDEPVLACVRRNDKRVHVDGLSDGTRDQLYLALRIASIERFLDGNRPLPLILDDAFVHFDDARAEAALGVLGELARRTQVLFFTHHYRMVQLAQRTLGREGAAIHTLGGELAIAAVDHGPLFS